MSKRASVGASAVLRESAYAPNEMTRPRWTTNMPRALRANFAVFAIAAVAVYLFLEILYVVRVPLIADEFDGAYDVYRLRDELPYVDFKPYKTVLGYYLQLPPLLLADRVWQGLTDSKIMLAVINAGCMLWTSLLLARRFSARAVALALPIWVLMSDWLERSGELRVDTLTAWAGLFSLLALIASRPALAGFLAALSFLISQKGAYFLVASGAGMVAVALIGPHVSARTRLRPLARFGAAYALTIGAYLAFWAALGSLNATTTATFFSHRAIVFSEIYPRVRRFWWQTLTRNPGYYALIVIALGWLGARTMRRPSTVTNERADEEGRERARDALLFGYGWVFAACIIWHKQPWPYFFVLLVPTAFVVHVWLFEHALRAYKRWSQGERARKPIFRAILLAGVLGVFAVCIALPATRVRPMLRQRNAYQRHMIGIADALLGPDDRYVAAADLMYDRDQSSSTLRRVSLVRRRELIDHPRGSSELILKDLIARPPKVLIRNERFESFPKRVLRHMRDNYTQFWGVIDLYAPRFKAGKSKLTIAFAGRYRITGVGEGLVHVGETMLKQGDTITLARGPIEIASEEGGRLRLQAEHFPLTLNKRMRHRRAFFGNAYER